MNVYNTKKNFTVNIFYASQLGFVESVAKYFEKEIKKNTKIIDMNIDILDNLFDYEINEGDLNYIFISTTGDGEFPDNAKSFSKKIRKEKNLNLKYSLFAFGDSNYRSFCHSGKITDRLLKNSGGEKIFETEYFDNAIDDNMKIEKWFEKNIDYINKHKKNIFDWFIENMTK